MNRAALLGGTAVAALLASFPATAGTVGSGDNLEVSMDGEVRFMINHVSQDMSAGFGRGYRFHTDEAEVNLEARNTANNGILYGVGITLNVNTDDTVNGDKVFAFLDHDNYGRVEMGDTDGAIDNMFVAAEDVLTGRASIDGDVGSLFNFGTTFIGNTNSNSGKSTKVTYFSPRIYGFQLGASWTPDSGGAGASFTERDDDGDFENLGEIAVNWVGSFQMVDIVVSAFAEHGEGDPNTAGGVNNTTIGDAEARGIGGTVSYAGFSLGGGFVDLQDSGITAAAQATGADAGQWWDIGGAYRTGPWGVSVGYFESTMSNAAGIGDTKNQVLSFGGDYEVAPGWSLAAEFDLIDSENNSRIQGNDNNGHLFQFHNIFTF